MGMKRTGEFRADAVQIALTRKQVASIWVLDFRH